MITICKGNTYRSKLLANQLRLVGSLVLAFGHGGQLALDQRLAQRRETIDEQLAVQVIVLVLNHPGREAVVLLVVFDEMLVHIADAYPFRPAHVLVQAGQAQATLAVKHLLAGTCIYKLLTINKL